MSKRCLIVTHLSLRGLNQKKYGVYRRLALLAEAAQTEGSLLRVFCIEPYVDICSSESGLSAEIAADILDQWGIECEVVIGRPKKQSTLPWLLQQFIGTLSYSWQPFTFHLLDKSSRVLLRQEVLKSPSYIIAHRLPMMNLLLTLKPVHTKIVFDLDDIEHVASIRSLSVITSWRGRLFTALSLPGLIYAEWIAVTRARVTFVCSQIDTARTAAIFRSTRVSMLPNAVEMPPISSRAPAGRVLLMVGIYSYSPNSDAADYFAKEIFPLIRSSYPDVELWFAGGSPESLKCYTMDYSGVRFLGFVDNLGDVYKQARVVICPIRLGSGTRVKLVEAAAWGKPIVTTTVGAEGLELKEDFHVLYGDTSQKFAEQCTILLGDMDLCEKLGKNARALAEASYEKHQIIQNLVVELDSSLE